jgi:cation:H+ antiporter
LSVAAVGLFAVLVRDGLGRTDGLVLAAALAACLGVLVWGALRRPREALSGDVAEFVDGDQRHRWGVELTRTFLGLAGTLAGAQFLVWGAAGIAERAGLSQALVGATVVAVGTSAPELVTAIQAARRGETGLLVGNVLGSNLFDSLAVGAVVVLAGSGVAADRTLAGLAVLLMVTVSLGAWWFLFRGRSSLPGNASGELAAQHPRPTFWHPQGPHDHAGIRIVTASGLWWCAWRSPGRRSGRATAPVLVAVPRQRRACSTGSRRTPGPDGPRRR